MTGLREDIFGGDVPASRGMVVTVLHRLEGEPGAGLTTEFSDVQAGKYYTSAVAWAAEEGLVVGFRDGNFRPDAPITRDQLAVILWRYAAYKGYPINAAADLSDYMDEWQISPYARQAIGWARAEGIVAGTDWGGIAPGSETTRAEAAAILMRLCKNVLEKDISV